MTDLHIADRVFATPHAIEEVPHVIAAAVEFHGATFGQLSFKQFRFAGLDAPARNENPTVRANELNAIGGLVSLANHVAIRDGAFVNDRHRDAVGIFQVHSVF